MSTQERHYTVDDLWQIAHRPEYEGTKLELADGALQVHPVGREHGRVTALILARLLVYVEAHDLGEVTTEVGHFTDPRNAKSPDVAFTAKARLPGPDVTGYVNQMPDLAVEVKSPTNTRPELVEKAHYYLNEGARVVWLVHLESRTVEVYTAADSPPVIYGAADLLDGGPVLPGFTLKLDDIFPD